MKKSILIIVIVMIVSVIVFAQTYRCQYDNNSMIWTGKTKTEYGKLTKEYRCPAGHFYWVVDQNSNVPPPPSYNRGPKCQCDNNVLTWTGKTKSEWGKLAKEYRCPIGHIYWLVD